MGKRLLISTKEGAALRGAIEEEEDEFRSKRLAQKGVSVAASLANPLAYECPLALTLVGYTVDVYTHDTKLPHCTQARAPMAKTRATARKHV